VTLPECPLEREVIAAIVAGRWPHDCDELLHVHAAECGVCKEVAAVADLLRVERETLHEEVNVPSAGQIWWRAAIRARLEASRQAARPLSWLFGASVACAAGLAASLVELLWSPVRQVVGGLTPAWTPLLGVGEIGRLLPGIADLTSLTATGGFLLLGAAACLVLAPLALYFALSDD